MKVAIEIDATKEEGSLLSAEYAPASVAILHVAVVVRESQSISANPHLLLSTFAGLRIVSEWRVVFRFGPSAVVVRTADAGSAVRAVSVVVNRKLHSMEPLHVDCCLFVAIDCFPAAVAPCGYLLVVFAVSCPLH